MFDQFKATMVAEIEKQLQHWVDMALKDAFSSKRFYEAMQGLSRNLGMDMFAWQGMMGQKPGFDPYQVLGLERTARDDQVKARYRELIRHLHPDTGHQDGTVFLLNLVLAAYSLIKEERKL